MAHNAAVVQLFFFNQRVFQHFNLLAGNGELLWKLLKRFSMAIRVPWRQQTKTLMINHFDNESVKPKVFWGSLWQMANKLDNILETETTLQGKLYFRKDLGYDMNNTAKIWYRKSEFVCHAPSTVSLFVVKLRHITWYQPLKCGRSNKRVSVVLL